MIIDWHDNLLADAQETKGITLGNDPPHLGRDFVMQKRRKLGLRPPLGLKTTPFEEKSDPLNRKNDPRGSQHFKIRVITQKKALAFASAFFNEINPFRDL